MIRFFADSDSNVLAAVLNGKGEHTVEICTFSECC